VVCCARMHVILGLYLLQFVIIAFVIVMLSSPSARSSSDLSFFSQSKVSKSGASTTSPVVVTTRLAKRLVPAAGPSDVPREVKRHRTAPAKEVLSKRKNNTSLKNPSRAASRQRTLPPSPEPIYRSSRSRSTSLFPGPELESDTHKRRWCSNEDGTPGEKHLSSEMVVERLITSYKSCEPPPGTPRRN
jgi:H3 lysine-79-specific histone-lysine N-methyltransferase